MTKKAITDATTGTTTLVDLTAGEETQAVEDNNQFKYKQTEIDNQATLKASAKAKLIAGEALTEAEADTIVL